MILSVKTTIILGWFTKTSTFYHFDKDMASKKFPVPSHSWTRPRYSGILCRPDSLRRTSSPQPPVLASLLVEPLSG